MVIFTCRTILLPFTLKYKFREEMEFMKLLKMAFLMIFIPNVFGNNLDSILNRFKYSLAIIEDLALHCKERGDYIAKEIRRSFEVILISVSMLEE